MSSPQRPPSSKKIEPSNYDVLCGKISNNLKHPGNVVFRDLVASRIDTYAKCVKKSQKGAVIDDIFYHLRRTGARFLRMDEETKQWFAIDLGEAREKVAHTIRDHMRKRRDAARRASQPEILVEATPSPPLSLLGAPKAKKAKKKSKSNGKHLLSNEKTTDVKRKKLKSKAIKKGVRAASSTERPRQFFISGEASNDPDANSMADDDDADEVIRNSAALGLASMKSLFDKKPQTTDSQPPPVREQPDTSVSSDNITHQRVPGLQKSLCSAPPSQELMAELLRVAPPKALAQSPVFNSRTGGFDLGTVDTATLQLLAKQQMALLMKPKTATAPPARTVPSHGSIAVAADGLSALMASLGSSPATRAPAPLAPSQQQSGGLSLATIPTSTLLMTLQHLGPASAQQAPFHHHTSPILNAVAMQQQQVSSSARTMIENELIARNPLLAVLGGLPGAGGMQGL